MDATGAGAVIEITSRDAARSSLSSAVDRPRALDDDARVVLDAPVAAATSRSASAPDAST